MHKAMTLQLAVPLVAQPVKWEGIHLLAALLARACTPAVVEIQQNFRGPT